MYTDVECGIAPACVASKFKHRVRAWIGKNLKHTYDGLIPHYTKVKSQFEKDILIAYLKPSVTLSILDLCYIYLNYLIYIQPA